MSLFAAFKKAGDGVALGLRDPETVFGLDGSLAGNVLAPESFVRRKPRCCIFVTFGTVGGAVGRQEIQWVVGEFLALVGIELLCALPPCIAESDDVVDLNTGAGVLAAHEGNRGADYLSARVPVMTTQLFVPCLNVSFVISRARMSLRVSQPLRSVSAQAGPNSSRV